MAHTIVFKNGTAAQDGEKQGAPCALYIDPGVSVAGVLIVGVSESQTPRGYLVAVGASIRFHTHPHITRCIGEDGRLRIQPDMQGAKAFMIVPETTEDQSTLIYNIVEER